MHHLVVRTVHAAVAVSFLIAGGVAQAAPSGLNAYDVPRSNADAQRLLAQQGFDLTEGGSGREIVATAEQAQALSKFGISTTPARRGSALAANVNADGSYNVYRPYF